MEVFARMPRLILALTLAVGILGMPISGASAANSWLMAGHDAQATNFNPGETAISPQNVARLRTVWRYPGVVQAVATARRVFAIVVPRASLNNVVVLDTRTGALLHTFTAAALHLATRPNDGPLDLAYGQGKLVIAGVSAVLAIDPDTGRQYWRAPGGAAVLTIAGGTVYTGKVCQNPCGTIASDAIDLQTGRVRWQHRENGGARPVLIASRLYQLWGQYNPETRVYEPQSGGLVARMPITAWWTGDRNSAYAAVPAIGARAGWLGQIGSTGKPRWKTNLGRVRGSGQPVLAYHTLYVPSNRFHPGLLAVNASNGKVRWAADLGPNLICIAANHLLFALHQANGQVDVLNVQTGRTVAHLTVPGFSSAGPSPGVFLSAGTLYIHDAQKLYALRALSTTR
jgi:outer membrane protein assembly factor BamB